MKFGKSLSAEARNNRNLAFINFKHLKRILKRSAGTQFCGTTALSPSAKTLNWGGDPDSSRSIFEVILREELAKVNTVYWEELSQITQLHRALAERLPSFEGITQDPATYTTMSFEDLQSHLQNLCGIASPEQDSISELAITAECSNTVNATAGSGSSAAAANCAALCEFCITLGKISSRCKQLRRCVLWNTIAIVKILKKQQKTTASKATGIGPRNTPRNSSVGAAQLLSQQDWYTSPDLGRIISLVETKTEEFMLKLTGKPPSRERFECPICLEIICDPVALRTCGHRFCWSCLCLAFFGRPENTLERCPSCRSSFPLDPDAFEVDGILRRFLKTFFPEEQKSRTECTAQELRSRLEEFQQNKRGLSEDDGTLSSTPAKRAAALESPSHDCDAYHPTRLMKFRPARWTTPPIVCNPDDVVQRVVEFLLLPEESGTRQVPVAAPAATPAVCTAFEQVPLENSHSTPVKFGTHFGTALDARYNGMVSPGETQIEPGKHTEAAVALSDGSRRITEALSAEHVGFNCPNLSSLAIDCEFAAVPGAVTLLGNPFAPCTSSRLRTYEGGAIREECSELVFESSSSALVGSVPHDKQAIFVPKIPMGPAQVATGAAATTTTGTSGAADATSDTNPSTDCCSSSSSCTSIFDRETISLPEIISTNKLLNTKYSIESSEYLADPLCTTSSLWPIVLPLLQDLRRQRLQTDEYNENHKYYYYYDDDDDEDEEEEEEAEEDCFLSKHDKASDPKGGPDCFGRSFRFPMPSCWSHICEQGFNTAEQALQYSSRLCCNC